MVHFPFVLIKNKYHFPNGDHEGNLALPDESGNLAAIFDLLLTIFFSNCFLSKLLEGKSTTN